MSRSQRRAAFTLVELLVVIGIIALLISVLLPALRAAKERANSVKCMAHQKQLMTAVMLYISDMKGSLPIMPSIGEYYPGSSPEQKSLMYYMSNSAPGGAGVIRYDVGAMWGYLLPGTNKAPPPGNAERPASKALLQIMNCPSDDMDTFRPVYWGSMRVDAAMKRNFSYSWNSHMRLAQDNADDVARKISKIRTPSHKILLIEELAPNDGQAWIMLNDPDDEPAFRHGGKANYGFADGHVQTMAPTELGFAKATGMQHTRTVDMKKCRYYFKLTKEQ